jgi:carboxylesterase
MIGLHGGKRSGSSARGRADTVPSLDCYRRRLARRLLLWFAASCAAGGALLLQRDLPLHALAEALGAWGLLGGAIALPAAGRLRRRSTRERGKDPLRLAQETRLVRRLLQAGIAAGGMGAAAGLPLGLEAAGGWRDAGWGIAAQGLLLVALGLLHLRRLPALPLPEPLPWFSGPEHRPFLLGGGGRAALLVHGFAGSPAEMRALAEELNGAGWSVRGMLLPGFGPQLGSLPEVHWRDWKRAVVGELQMLRALYSGVLLVGFSLGGAISLAAAAEEKPDGLVLLAPFTRAGGDLKKNLGALLLPYVSRFFYPLKDADFSNLRLRKALEELLPEADLEDARTISALRSVGVPSSILEQVVRVGQQGRRAAASLSTPVLLIQGKTDTVVNPEDTRRLLRRFPLPALYLEVPAPHSLVRPSSPAWDQVSEEVVAFAEALSAAEVRREKH